MNSYTEENNNQLPEMRQNLDVLQDLAFFSSFPVQSLKLLALVAQRVEFEEDEIIFETGDDHACAYIVLEGQLTLISEQHQSTIKNYCDGDLVGLLSLFAPVVSLFSLKASTTTRVLSVRREHFLNIQEQFPETVQLAVKALVKEIHQWERKNLAAADSRCLHLTGITSL
jgi:CRP-like cAMP-binding protein